MNLATSGECLGMLPSFRPPNCTPTSGCVARPTSGQAASDGSRLAGRPQRLDREHDRIGGQRATDGGVAEFQLVNGGVQHRDRVVDRVTLHMLLLVFMFSRPAWPRLAALLERAMFSCFLCWFAFAVLAAAVGRVVRSRPFGRDDFAEDAFALQRGQAG